MSTSNEGRFIALWNGVVWRLVIIIILIIITSNEDRSKALWNGVVWCLVCFVAFLVAHVMLCFFVSSFVVFV